MESVLPKKQDMKYGITWGIQPSCVFHTTVYINYWILTLVFKIQNKNNYKKYPYLTLQRVVLHYSFADVWQMLKMYTVH